MNGGWFDEALGVGMQLGLKIDSILYRETTDLQDLVIYQTSDWGRVMALDGIMQVCERDEFIYHEMLTHMPHAGPRICERSLHHWWW